MSTVFVATTPKDVSSLLPWAWHLAAARRETLTVLFCSRGKGETRLRDVDEGSDGNDAELLRQARQIVQQLSEAENCADPEITLKQLVGDSWKENVTATLTELAPDLLIAAAPAFRKSQADDAAWQSSLLSDLECEVMLVQDDSNGFDQPLNLAVFVTDEADNEAALRCAKSLTDCFGGTTTAVYVQPNVSDHSAAIGERQLSNLLARLAGRTDSVIRHQVIVAQSTSDALKEIEAAPYHLMLMGTRSQRQMRQFFRANPVANEDSEQHIPAVAVVQRSATFGNKIRTRVARKLRSKVPQLAREERIALVTRIQESSRWDFDFVLLISLATLIACLGLAENSGAVIVGAMLVAPLMTPIAGVGLGVAHANAYLTKVAFRTALRGFATAIMIGVFFGLAVQVGSYVGWLEPLLSSPIVTVEVNGGEVTSAFPSEMEGRTKPQFYDLLIALASGVAAAYAMGRPNLYSALPGVAIAAALVPPIATSGIAFSYGQFLKGGGALLLFITNMVVIILGTSIVFSAVGIRSQKEGPNAARWPRYVLLLLVILSVAITMVIEYHGQHMRSLSPSS